MNLKCDKCGGEDFVYVGTIYKMTIPPTQTDEFFCWKCDKTFTLERKELKKRTVKVDLDEYIDM